MLKLFFFDYKLIADIIIQKNKTGVCMSVNFKLMKSKKKTNKAMK